MDPISKKVLGHIGEKVSGELVGPAVGRAVAGVGFVAIEVLDYKGEKRERDVLAKAQEILGGCPHLEIVPHNGYAGITDLALKLSSKKQGVAFTFDGVSLWHFDNALD